MFEHVTLVLGVLIVYLVASMWGIFIDRDPSSE